MLNLCVGGCSAYVRFHPPVPVKLRQSWVSVEEAAVPSAHVAVADHPTFAHANGSQILQAVHESALIDPIGQGPVVFRHHLVIDFGRCQVSSSSLHVLLDATKMR